MRFFDNPNSTAGKVTVSLVVATVVILAVLFSFDFTHKQIVERVEAQANATTTVTVLNTPPDWTVDGTENPESSTSSPTNATSSVNWIATATDPNGQDYFLIICKTGAAATANSDTAPSCSGGASNMWAVSGTTTSGTQATATYATLISDAELNDWYASVCDADTVNPACNTDIQQGTGDAGSPFHVNHRPNFTLIDITPSSGDPGDVVTWQSTSSDPDTIASDTVQLFICKTSAFDYSTPQCSGGASNTWATSSLYASDAEASTTITIPTQDATYNAYAFVTDSHGFAALDSAGGPTSSPLTVNNVAPTVSSSTITLNYGNDMTLTTEGGQTTGFTLTFIVSDDNSCVANGSTTSEFSDAVVSVFRSGVTAANCAVSGDFDTNNCYTTTASTSLWAFTAPTATSTNTCTGPTDTTQAYEFTFPLWFNADPTDGTTLTDSTWFNEDWIASVAAVDDNNATGTTATSSSGVDLLSFLASNLTTSSIAFGSIAPGGTTTPLSATTTLQATGNVGLDETLQGEDMCTTYTVPGSCSPFDETDTIAASQQVYATSSVTYALGTALSSTTATELELDAPKTTATATPATGDTLWGIAIPIQITLSGTYTGQNTITAVKGEAQQW